MQCLPFETIHVFGFCCHILADSADQPAYIRTPTQHLCRGTVAERMQRRGDTTVRQL
jgi:hypothetical protein